MRQRTLGLVTVALAAGCVAPIVPPTRNAASFTKDIDSLIYSDDLCQRVENNVSSRNGLKGLQIFSWVMVGAAGVATAASGVVFGTEAASVSPSTNKLTTSGAIGLSSAVTAAVFGYLASYAGKEINASEDSQNQIRAVRKLIYLTQTMKDLRSVNINFIGQCLDVNAAREKQQMASTEDLVQKLGTAIENHLRGDQEKSTTGNGNANDSGSDTSPETGSTDTDTSGTGTKPGDNTSTGTTGDTGSAKTKTGKGKTAKGKTGKGKTAVRLPTEEHLGLVAPGEVTIPELAPKPNAEGKTVVQP